MLIGHDRLISNFKKLVNSDKLSHAYLFFGEPQVGKFLFAQNLANFLENQVFNSPSSFLNETLFIVPNEASAIGIDIVRSIKHFLYQKPLNAQRRVVIVGDAENLTDEAQNALLKILEEPPVQSLLIFIAADYEKLFPAVISRLQKIYFPRVSSAQIEKFLMSQYKIDWEKARKIAADSFGRPGRAVDLLENKNLEKAKKNVKEFQRLHTLEAKRKFIKQTFISKEDKFDDKLMDKFFEFLIIELRQDCLKNFKELREVFKRLTLIKQFNVNKKLQIQCL